jgi:transcriptional regulator with XRE-family HTH domain
VKLVCVSMSANGIESAELMRNLARALREVRRYRGMSAAQVAKAMSMPLRSYQHFEAGNGKLNIDSIFRFAAATNSDGRAILAAIDMGEPEFAVYCADNKLMLILKFALQDFHARAGKRIGAMRSAALIGAFSAVFEDLATRAEAEGRELDEWLAGYEHRRRQLGRPSD